MAAENTPNLQIEDGLREIEALVEANPPEEIPIPDSPEESADLETVARDLGISVAEVREMMNEGLG